MSATSILGGDSGENDTLIHLMINVVFRLQGASLLHVGSKVSKKV